MYNADVRSRLASLGHAPTSADIADALRASGQVVSDVAVLAVQEDLRRDCEGIGILEPLLALPGLTDILVNGPDQVFVDCGEGLTPVDVGFDSDGAVRQLGVRLAASAGRRLDDGSPFVDARLPNGLRFHAILSGVADPGTCISLRIPARQALSLDDWIESGCLSPGFAAILARIVETKCAFLISGGTGTGKTTLLATMLSSVPSTHRIVIVEDSRELAPRHPHVVRLEARPQNIEGAGLVTMTDLVRQGLRMRPDRLVVGEVRGAEIIDMLQALNTGHEGGCGTVHANSSMDVPARLEALAALGGLTRGAAHAQMASALDLVIHLDSSQGHRAVREIGVFETDDSGMVHVESALRLAQGSTLVRRGGAQKLERMLA